MAVPVTNFGLVTVSTTYGSGDTTIVLTTGHGSRLPATTGGYRYPLTWWDSTNYPHPADDPNVEIVIVTNRSSDTLTVTRAQESTSASTKNTGGGAVYRMSLGITKSLWEGARPVKNTHQGLILQTDRDYSDNVKMVELTAADYLVMDDGMISDNSGGGWSGKTADITVSGAGGLDTGAEEASAWYEIYAIETEAGTKNLLLHKSRSHTLDANYIINDDSYQDIRSASTNQFVAQGFQAVNSGRVVFADARLIKVGSPTGTLYCTIYSNNSGLPGSALIVSHALDVSRLSTAADTWVRFTFPDSAPTLSAGTTYHLMVGSNCAVSGTNYIKWRMDGSAGAFSGGSKSTWNGTLWTADADDDMMFSIGVEVSQSAVTMPSGYTKKCFLGWVYNDSGSNFIKFMQIGRSTRSSSITAYGSLEVLSGNVDILIPNIPPIEMCTVMMACAGTGSSAAVLAAGDTRSLDISSSGTTTGAQAIIESSGTSTRPGAVTSVFLQRGFCFAQGTLGGTVYACGFSW